MTQLSHSKRRQRRRVARHMIHTNLLTLDLTHEEMLTDLDPNWFQGVRDDKSGPVEQARTNEAAA